MRRRTRLRAGAHQLIARHAPYAGVNEEGAARWLTLMVPPPATRAPFARAATLRRCLRRRPQDEALGAVPAIAADADARARLMRYFRRAASAPAAADRSQRRIAPSFCDNTQVPRVLDRLRPGAV